MFQDIGLILKFFFVVVLSITSVLSELDVYLNNLILATDANDLLSKIWLRCFSYLRPLVRGIL